MKRISILCLVALLAAAPGDAPVAEAAMRGDLDAVQVLLREGADVNAPQGDGMTALHWASEQGHVQMVQVLLDAGANVNAVTRIGDYTPLHLASQESQAAVVAALLAAGGDPDAATTTGGATPLHFAAAVGNTEAITTLLEHGADVNVREASIGQTPLIFATSYDRLAAVNLLLERGADMRIMTRMSDPGLDAATSRAAQKVRGEAFAAIRPDAEARVGGYSPKEVQQAVLAARKAVPQQEEEVEEEDPDDLDKIRYGRVGDYGGLTALLHATREGHRDVTMALLDAGADLEQSGTGEHISPLLMTVVNGHFDLAMELLARGADPSFQSNSGNNPLYAAIDAQWAAKSTARPRQRAYEQQQTTYLQMMEALLLAGIDPNIRLRTAPPYEPRANSSVGLDGATPFFRAALALDVTAMQLLLRNGADDTMATIKSGSSRRRRSTGRRGGTRGGGPPGPDPSGLPPIPNGGPGVFPVQAASGVGYGQGFAAHSHRHVPDGWMPAMRFLVDGLGHDVNSRDMNGYTPLHHAAARGHDEMILYLIEHGADVKAKSRRGQTVADMANQPTARLQIFPETRALLMRLGSELTGKPKY